MGQKKKVGKQRRDKAYWSAKELGFRSRASFKLVQLNRKHEFLQKSRVCIDLCAAPGSWMQVAKEHMPMSSLIVGIDLVPIKPIPGCINIIGDITTDKCRTDLKKELQNWKADLVLHDGAPNVGKNWIHDAYQQSLLTLASFKLATEFLTKGGTFVTKVFRSKDYQSLMWVFSHFFRNVHATKPAASRNESAEIFVVCLGYKAPEKIDPKFLDPRSVFSEVEPIESSKKDELINPERKKKAPAEGYETGQTLLYNKAKASEFIAGDKPIHILNNCHEIVLDESRIKKHPKTTQEIVECCKDIRVLGVKELRSLKKWREILKADFEKAAEKKAKEAKKEGTDEKNAETEMGDSGSEAETEEDSDMEELDKEIATMATDEKRAERRKKKIALKEKRKTAQRIDLKMIIPGDQGPTKQEEGLFKISDLKSAKDVELAIDQAGDNVAADADSEDEQEPKAKFVKFSKDKEEEVLEEDLQYSKKEGSDDEGDEEGLDSDEESDHSGNEDMDIEAPEANETVDDQTMEKLNKPSDNPLLVTMEEKDAPSLKERKASMWFGKDVFQGIEDDEELEEADVKKAIQSIKNQGGAILTAKQKKAKIQAYNSDDSDDEELVSRKVDKNGQKEPDADESSDSSSSDEENADPKESRKRKKKTKTKKMVLTPEELALGQEMIKSKKTRRDIMDQGWNRFMFDDKDKDLPEWFVKEEEFHMRIHPDVDPEVVQFYKNRQQDVNVKTIKKVVEAKARKKRLLSKRLNKAKKKASALIENEDLGSREKSNEIKKMYKKAYAAVKPKETQYVVAKKFTANARAKRPAGCKGPYKQVDPRMKKDKAEVRQNASTKRLQKRRLKGKKTRPNAPTPTEQKKKKGRK